MSWTHVTVFGFLVLGALGALALKSESLAMVFAGGAAGYLAQKKEDGK